MEGLPTFKGIICHIDLVIMYDFIWMRALKFYLVICFSWQLDIDFDDMTMTFSSFEWAVLLLLYDTNECFLFYCCTHVCCKWILDFYCEELIFIVKNWFIFSSLMIFLLQSLDPCFYVFSLGIALQVFETRTTTTKSNSTIGICFMNFWDQKNNNTDFKMLPHNNKFVKCLCCSSNHSVVQP